MGRSHKVGNEMKELPGIINTESFSEHLRARAIKVSTEEVLMTRFQGSLEATDFSAPMNCQGFGRVHHFRRHQVEGWPPNPLPIDPCLKALGLGARDVLRAQVFQNAVCNWRCWYCFVDFSLLAGDQRFSSFVTADQLLDLYQAEPDRALILDLSGGQPDLVPEWSYWMIRAIAARDLTQSVYLWSDDNLSNDYLWRFLTPKQRTQMVESNHYGRVGCFKGFDRTSFTFNTRADASLYLQQFGIMRRLLDEGFDAYGYVTLTTNVASRIHERMKEFVDLLQEQVHPLFPLRVVPLHVAVYTPTSERLDEEKRFALATQQEAVIAWKEELDRRFPEEIRLMPITEHAVSSR
jgi:uncharacterized Fe-S cluster-containing radical SAM superfamily protein